MRATLLLILVVILFAFTFLNKSQPKPLVEQNVTFQPIVENIDSGSDYWYIRTIKIYYDDPMKKIILLSNGDTLKNYCTDSTRVTFISNNDTIVVYSVKRMSCVILTVINLKDEHISFLKQNALKRVLIENLVTDNTINIQIKDSMYFKNVLKTFEGKYIKKTN